MARKMYIYRADYQVAGEPKVHFFYARNARVAKENMRSLFDEIPVHLILTKIGLMKDEVESVDACVMKKEEEKRLIDLNFGQGTKFAERDD